MSPIAAFGWHDNAPPDIDAANLEAMHAAAGAYTDAKIAAAPSVFLDARQWGVKGDNSTDNHTPLTNLTTSMLSSGPGAKAILPPGIILTGGPLTVSGQTGELGMYWAGHGRKATTLRKTFNGDLVQMIGTGTGFAAHVWSCGLSDMTLDGNAGIYTGRLLDLAYSHLMSFDNIHFTSNADIGIDTTETWDTTFTRCFLENVGSLTAPSVWVRSARAASGFGASTDTTNEIRFSDGFHCESFVENAIRVEPGTSGNHPNKIFLHQFKMESYSVAGPPILINGADDVYVGQGNVQMGAFAGGFSTPVAAIYCAPSSGWALRDIFIGVSGAATCEEGVYVWEGGYPGIIDNVYGEYTIAPTSGKHINLAGGGPYHCTNCHSYNATTEVYTAPGVQLLDPTPAKAYCQQAASYAALPGDEYIGVVTTSTACTITLPALSSVNRGKVYVIKDESGLAATHNITLARTGADTIDGATSKTISAAYGSLKVVATATGWSMV